MMIGTSIVLSPESPSATTTSPALTLGRWIWSLAARLSRQVEMSSNQKRPRGESGISSIEVIWTDKKRKPRISGAFSSCSSLR